jgi:hypothetical protein
MDGYLQGGNLKAMATIPVSSQRIMCSEYKLCY